MLGILIVTHGNFGVELLKTAELIIGKAENTEAVSLNYGDDIKILKSQVAEKIQSIDRGEGVIVFTDLFGGSPNTSVAANLKDMNFKALSGVNLPMLLECITSREVMDTEELISHIGDVGRDSIKILNDLF